MIELRPRETVLMAENPSTLVAWYRDVLGFEVTADHEDEYHYTNLETPSGIKLGIARADEMGVKPVNRNSNTVLLQFEVDDLDVFFDRLVTAGGSVKFGPSFDEKNRFWYGGFADPEGNPCWVVDANCP